jgi:hypothetical protein
MELRTSGKSSRVHRQLDKDAVRSGTSGVVAPLVPMTIGRDQGPNASRRATKEARRVLPRWVRQAPLATGFLQHDAQKGLGSPGVDLTLSLPIVTADVLEDDHRLPTQDDAE